MMKYDDLYFASRYNFFTDCVEWYFLPKTEIKVFLKKMDIRGFGWRPSIYIYIYIPLYMAGVYFVILTTSRRMITCNFILMYYYKIN